MELFNELPDERMQDVEDFLTFIPIYESKRRTISLMRMLKAHRAALRGKVCMEAGAGRGIFAKAMAELGARKVYAVERSGVMFDLLKANTADDPRITSVHEDILDFEPEEPIDVLFHELYGPLVLDETMLLLRELPFEPGLILPDGGRLWAMPLTEAEVQAANPHYEPTWKTALQGALVSELIEGIPFKQTWEVFHWNVADRRTKFRFKLPAKADFIALCGEITHAGQPVLDMAWTNNWPVIYTPVAGKEFELRFEVEDGFTLVHFTWLR
jgi:SAM-dependent methyltransferase